AARQRVARSRSKVESLTAAVATASLDCEEYGAKYAVERGRLAQAHDSRLARERELGALRLAATSAGSRQELTAERAAAANLSADEAAAMLAQAREQLA